MDGAAGREVRDRVYSLAVVVALLTLVAAVVCAVALGLPMRDPDGFLGPTYVRLPLIAGGLLALDVVPRAVRRAGSPRAVPRQVVDVVRERWPWHRLRPALIGLAAFYATYVAYRNLKHYLPFLRPQLVDRQLDGFDRALTGGTPPAQLLHDVLGTGVSAHVLSWVYLAFLAFVPASLGIALVMRGRSREASWYVTALCLNWSLGTASYYLLPSMGPVYDDPGVFSTLPETGTSALQTSLLISRSMVIDDPQTTDRIQSIAAFASLHVSIVLTAAVIAQVVLRSRALRALLWVYVGLTTVATVYFGWHYVLDDVAGVVIAAIAVGLGGWGTGQFRRSPAAVEEPATERRGPGRRVVPVRLRRRPQTSPTAP